MIQELRQVILTGDELITAIECQRRINQGFVPAGEISACAPAGPSAVKLRIETAGERGITQTEVVVNGGDLLKALIRFCHENNIPVPRQGRKIVDIEGDSSTMQIVLKVDSDIPAWNMPAQLVSLRSLAALFPADIMLDKLLANGGI